MTFNLFHTWSPVYKGNTIIKFIKIYYNSKRNYNESNQKALIACLSEGPGVRH